MTCSCEVNGYFMYFKDFFYSLFFVGFRNRKILSPLQKLTADSPAMRICWVNLEKDSTTVKSFESK